MEKKPLKKKIRSSSPEPLRNYRGKRPWKTILLSFLLLFSGIFFVLTGGQRYLLNGYYENFPLLLLGFLLFIPGIYHTIIVAMIWWGVDGFSYDMIQDEEY